MQRPRPVAKLSSELRRIRRLKTTRPGSEYHPELYSDRARLRITHKAKELLTRARVIADHAEQAAGGQRGSEHVHTT
jgi:hypothetical protein